MHPLEKIILLLAACQLLQTIYLVAHVQALHGSSRWRYLAKMVPLLVLTILMVVLVLRIFQIIPFIGI